MAVWLANIKLTGLEAKANRSQIVTMQMLICYVNHLAPGRSLTTRNKVAANVDSKIVTQLRTELVAVIQIAVHVAKTDGKALQVKVRSSKHWDLLRVPCVVTDFRNRKSSKCWRALHQTSLIKNKVPISTALLDVKLGMNMELPFASMPSLLPSSPKEPLVWIFSDLWRSEKLTRARLNATLFQLVFVLWDWRTDIIPCSTRWYSPEMTMEGWVKRPQWIGGWEGQMPKTCWRGGIKTTGRFKP